MSSADAPRWVTLAPDESVVWGGRPSPYLVKYWIGVAALVLLAGIVALVWILPSNWSLIGWLTIVAGLVVVNLLAINLSALVLFWLAGFKPLEAGRFEGVRASVVSRIVVIAIGIAVLSIALGAVTWTTFQAQSFERQTQAELQQRFDEADIEGVELVSVTVDYEPDDILLGNEPKIDVLVGVPRDQAIPSDLAQRWDDELSEEFGRDVVVRVGFVEAQVSEEEPPNPPLGWPTGWASSPNGVT